jgi:hypothetical protein
VQEPAQPAVPIRRSVQQDFVVGLECGLRAQVLRRHLRVAHGLDIADYRARWQLPMDYPLTAPSYSARRSRMAKAIGFGRRRGTEPAGNRTARDPASRSTEAHTAGNITPTVWAPWLMPLVYVIMSSHEGGWVNRNSAADAHFAITA